MKPYIRLTEPLVRDGGARCAGDAGTRRSIARPRASARPSSAHGPQRFGLFSCSKATNEVNYLAQKFARARHRQQQHRQLQPHLTRPQRRRSDDGVRRGRRDELVPGDRGDRPHHPVGIERARDAPDLLPSRAEGGAQRGAAVSPSIRGGRPRPQWADAWLGLDVGSDIALANAMGREIIAAGPRATATFIERATTGFDAYRASVETVHARVRRSAMTGVPAAVIRELAHAYATAPTAPRSAGRSASPSTTTPSTTCSRSSTWRC